MPEANEPARRLIGRDPERERIGAALRAGRFPQSLLISGGEGTGKKRLAFWAARALLCETGEGAPCESCPSCTMARGLAHPDLLIFVPHGRPGSGSAEAQISRAEGFRADRLQELRAEALYSPPESDAAYYMASVRALLHEAGKPAAGGRGRVVVLTEAERLDQADQSGAASNALLKLLEEPVPGTRFILTSSAPHRLLDTIRSRTTELRLAPYSQSELADVIEAGSAEDVPPPAPAVLAAARGSVTRATALMAQDVEGPRAHALGLLSAAVSGDAVLRLEAVSAQSTSSARGELGAALDQMEHLVESALLATLGTRAQADGLPDLAGLGEEERIQAWAAAAGPVLDAQARLAANVNPRLVVHRLLLELEGALCPQSRQTNGKERVRSMLDAADPAPSARGASR